MKRTAGWGGARSARRDARKAAGTAGALLLLVLLAGTGGCGGRDGGNGGAPYRGRHVVLLNIETLRADCCGAWGGPSGWTPAIDSLAARGIVVEEAYTVAPWTRPSVASLWTGLYPSRHGADRMEPDARLPEEALTLAERFAAAGYRTFAAVTNANLSPDLGFAQGFEEYRYRIGAPADTLAAWAMEWLDSRPGGDEEAPLFLAFHFDEPHGAFFQTAFRSGVDGKSRAEMIRRAETLSDGERIAALEAYRARVRTVDRAVGRLVRALESRLGPDLLLVLTADHGEEWFDHGGLFHGFTLYEELLRVPLLFFAPGVEPARAGGPARSVDIAPTLVAWTGLASSGGRMDGRALGPALAGGEPFPGEVFAETRYERELLARIDGGRKWIVDISNDDVEIYDLAIDPREARDLSGADPAGAERAVRFLGEWRAARENVAIAEKAGERMDDAARRELERDLRSIGYLGGGGGGSASFWPRGKRIGWRDLYRRYELLRPGDPEIRFSEGDWKEGAHPPRRVGAAGASLTAAATASRNAFLLLGAHPWSGIAEILVDGAVRESVDLYQPERGDRQRVVPTGALGPGLHTIRIRATGSRNGEAQGAELLFDGIAIERADAAGGAED